MKYIRADQELTEAMEEACTVVPGTPCETYPLLEDWTNLRDSAPTVDAVPVEELRTLAKLYKALADDARKLFKAYGTIYNDGRTDAFDSALERLEALLAQHTSERP